MSTDRQDLAADVAKLDDAHRNGFDHGRRWAAEELLRIAAREIRLQSSWLWHQLGERNLTEFCADLGRRLIAEIGAPDPEPYFCPTSGQIESPTHGGFDVCCDRPQLHQPVAADADIFGESQDPDAVMSDGERGYQQAIDHLREKYEQSGGLLLGYASAAAYLEARRGDEEHRP